jgi:Zn-dependent protease with chaperone function
MSIPVTCSKCRASFRVKDDFAGKRGKCPNCQETVAVPPFSASNPESKSAIGRKSTTSVPPPETGSGTPNAMSSAQPAGNTQGEVMVDLTVTEDELLAAFQGDIERVRATWTYWLTLIAVGAVMVLLPVIYAGIICLVAYGMYLHAVYDVWFFRAVGARGLSAVIAGFILYLGVLLAGVLAVLFMIKPFFARSAQVERRRSLTPSGEPLLFAFVDRICDAVGSQRPRRIDVDCQVNAAASFRRGFWSMIVGGDMVLTIGLSLAAGMTIQQFGGVLAHEFGHFSQGVGMRMSYLIRTISFWFTRVVYDRDVWDQRLIDWSENPEARVAVVLLSMLTRFLIWCSRRVLWLLMIIGNGVSGYLLRQMEFDADRYETRLGGSESFEQSTRRLAVLSIAYQGALSDLDEFHREGCLGDNLPRLVAVNAKEVPDDRRQKINKVVDQSTTRMFATHPCDRDRIAKAKRENAVGVFHDSRPATSLFTNFDDLAKNCTWDFYRGVFGENFRPIDMHPIDQLLAPQGRDARSRKALDRFFQGTFSGLRILPLPKELPASDRVDTKATIAELKEARAKMIEMISSIKKTLATYTTYDTHLMELEIAQPLFALDLEVQPKTFSVPLTSLADAVDVASTAASGQQTMVKQLEPFEAAASRRMVAALTLLRAPRIAKRMKYAETFRLEAERLLPVLTLMRQSLPQILQLRNSNAALNLLVGQVEANRQNPDLFQSIQKQMQTVTTNIRQLSEKLSDCRYPLDHSGANISIAIYALEELPCCDDISAIVVAANRMLDNLMSLYVRMCSRLAASVEAVETILGLPLLPDPTE